MKEEYRNHRTPWTKDGTANQLKYQGQKLGPAKSRGNVKIVQRMAMTMATIKESIAAAMSLLSQWSCS